MLLYILKERTYLIFDSGGVPRENKLPTFKFVIQIQNGAGNKVFGDLRVVKWHWSTDTSYKKEYYQITYNL